MRRQIQLAAAFAVLLLAGARASAATVEYRFTVGVSITVDPAELSPPPAHFAGVGLITHDSATSFWTTGAPPSIGMANMAVTGCVDSVGACNPANTPAYTPYPRSLEDDFNDAAGLGGAEFLYKFTQAFLSPSTTEFSFLISDANALVTAVAMIGPSPDWFIGVGGLDLRPGGVWANSLSVPLFAYKGGVKTDNSMTFNPAGPEHAPWDDIHLLTPQEHPLAGQVLGTFSFDLVAAPEPSSLSLGLLGLAAFAALGAVCRRRFTPSR